MGAENIALQTLHFHLFCQYHGGRPDCIYGSYSWAKVSLAGCNEIPDEILGGHSPRCRLTHLGGPIWLSGSRARFTYAAVRVTKSEAVRVLLVS